MYCIGTIKQLKVWLFRDTGSISITPRPCLFPSAALLEINLGSGQWKLPISFITILKLYDMNQAFTVIPLVITMVYDHKRITYPLKNSLKVDQWPVGLTCILPQGWSNFIGQLNL